jgi:hypothetical protein
VSLTSWFTIDADYLAALDKATTDRLWPNRDIPPVKTYGF